MLKKAQATQEEVKGLEEMLKTVIQGNFWNKKGLRSHIDRYTQMD